MALVMPVQVPLEDERGSQAVGPDGVLVVSIGLRVLEPASTSVPNLPEVITDGFVRWVWRMRH
jgi:hypothetical protein